ncbi:MAG: retroviral-like aspartic protease family protein, partial [Acidobacteriota bacterium]|nr:retroviral-like aspartic protease family protein [Acidobacteriota bacterium]
MAASLSHGTSKAVNEGSAIEVPFLFDHKLVFVKVTINGKGPFNMLLDTGSDISAVNLTEAREIGLQLGAKGRVEGAGTDQTKFYRTRLAQVEVGGLTVKDISAGAIDLSKIGQALHTNLDGVLGYNFLQGRVVQIDYPKRVVRFYSVMPFPSYDRQQNSERRVALPFRQPEYGPVIEEV